MINERLPEHDMFRVSLYPVQLFSLCNRWLLEVLKRAGAEINSFFLIEILLYPAVTCRWSREFKQLSAVSTWSQNPIRVLSVGFRFLPLFHYRPVCNCDHWLNLFHIFLFAASWISFRRIFCLPPFVTTTVRILSHYSITRIWEGLHWLEANAVHIKSLAKQKCHGLERSRSMDVSCK